MPEEPPPPASPAGPRRTLLRFLPLALLLLGLVLFVALGGSRLVSLDALRFHRTGLMHWVAAHRVPAMLLYAAGYAVAVAFSLPIGLPLTLAGGFLLGTVAGALLATVGGTAGATLLFLIARHALGPSLRPRVAGTLARFQAGFERHAFNYMLFLRLIPLFPFWLVNLAPAFTTISTRTYVIATLLGVLPAATVFAGIGNGLGAVFDQGREVDLDVLARPDVALPLIGLAVLALLPVAWRHWKGRRA